MEFRNFQLKDLLENFSVRAKDYGGAEGLDFLGVSNEDGITKSKYAAEDKAEDYKIIEKGCFAYNPYRINVGSIAYLNEDIKGLISPAYVVFKTKENTIDDRLLLKFLKSAEGIRQIRENARGTVRQALRYEDLGKIKISLPPFKEQVLLLNKIDTSDSASNNIQSQLNHQLSLISQLRQAFLREAMQGTLVSNETKDGATGAQLLAEIKKEKEQLVKEKKIKKQKPLAPISNDEIPFEIPENWAWCRLGEICTKITDGFHHSVAKINRGYPYISAMHIRDNKINWDSKLFVSEKEHKELYKKASPKKGDILITNRGALCGTPAIIDVDYEFSFQNAGLIGFNQSLLLSKYLLFFILLRRDEIMLQFVNGGLQPMLSNVMLAKLEIPLPPLEIQERIVAQLDELMQYCDALEEQVKESRALNEQLLQQVLREALEGKTDELKDLSLVAESISKYSIN